MSEFNVTCSLVGQAPIMFDRYPGDNKTKLPVRERAMLNDKDEICIQALAIYSMLTAENTKSVARQFGKAGKSVATDIAAGMRLSKFIIPLCREDGPIVMPAELPTDPNESVHVRYDVARVKGGIPNPKERPVINTPWRIDLSFTFLEGDNCKIKTLRDALERAGRYIGLGTFRPFFGQFEVHDWKQTEI